MRHRLSAELQQCAAGKNYVIFCGFAQYLNLVATGEHARCAQLRCCTAHTDSCVAELLACCRRYRLHSHQRAGHGRNVPSALLCTLLHPLRLAALPCFCTSYGGLIHMCLQHVNPAAIGSDTECKPAINKYVLLMPWTHATLHGWDSALLGRRYMIIFGAMQLLFTQIPNMEEIWWVSIVAAIMSFVYSIIGLGLSIGKATGVCFLADADLPVCPTLQSSLKYLLTAVHAILRNLSHECHCQQLVLGHSPCTMLFCGSMLAVRSCACGCSGPCQGCAHIGVHACRASKRPPITQSWHPGWSAHWWC